MKRIKKISYSMKKATTSSRVTVFESHRMSHTIIPASNFNSNLYWKTTVHSHTGDSRKFQSNNMMGRKWTFVRVKIWMLSNSTNKQPFQLNCKLLRNLEKHMVCSKFAIMMSTCLEKQFRSVSKLRDMWCHNLHPRKFMLLRPNSKNPHLWKSWRSF